jgi:hypothetical protein
MATFTLTDDLGALAPEVRVDLKSRLLAYERELITAALAESRGNQRRAAHRLGILPTTLHEKMKRLGLRADAFLPGGQPAEAAPGAAPPAQEPTPAGEARF